MNADRILRIADVLLAPFVFCAALLLKSVRLRGVARMPIARAIFHRLGVLPITTHYYDPWAARQVRRRPLDEPRPLPGVDLRRGEQLALLREFRWGEELRTFPLTGPQGTFFYRNGTFGAGDAEVLYSMIRLKRPKTIIEIGGGSSTLVIAAAVARNRSEEPAYACRHVCVEPYENPWLESTGAEIVRKRIEEVEPELFAQLGRNDILFIDSSHVIRPQGDVLALYADVLPRLSPGVLVHIHDIFTPRDYPARWLDGSMLLWNEQYLLEAFLAGNRDFRVVAALNMLYRDESAALNAACPVLAAEGGPEPGSFWLMRQE